MIDLVLGITPAGGMGLWRQRVLLRAITEQVLEAGNAGERLGRVMEYCNVHGESHVPVLVVFV